MGILADILIFLVSTLPLLYAPGSLVLRGLGCRLAGVDKLTFSLSLGLVASSIVYWLFGISGVPRYFPLWPAAVTGIALTIWWKDRSRLRDHAAAGPETSEAKRAIWHLVPILILGLAAMAVLPQFFKNLTSTEAGEVVVYPVADSILHLTIVNELIHTVPAKSPFFSGSSLNYHTGSDLVSALFYHTTRIDPQDLSLRLVPVLFTVLSMSSVFCFSRRWFGSGHFAALATFLIFFGEDFSFVPGLLCGESGDWSVVFFGVPAVFSLFFQNPMLPALGLLFAGLFCLDSYMREGRKTWMFLAAIFFAALLEIKVFTALHVMFSLGVSSLVCLAACRDWRLFTAAAVTAVISIPSLSMLFIHNQGAATQFGLVPWPYVSHAMDAIGFGGKFESPLGFWTVALPVYILGSLGFRLLGLPALVCSLLHPARQGGIRVMLAVMVLSGIILTLAIRFIPAGVENPYNNGVWFLVQSKYVAWVFTIEILQRVYQNLIVKNWRPARVGTLLATLAIASSIPSTLHHFYHGKREQMQGRTVFTTGQVAVSRFLKKKANPGDTVLCNPETTWAILSFTHCRVPLGLEVVVPYAVPYAHYKERKGKVDSFWASWAEGNPSMHILNELKVRYLVVTNKDGRAGPEDALITGEVYRNSDFTIFDVSASKIH